MFSRNSHVQSDDGRLDSDIINLVEVFEISINSFSGSENVDSGGRDLPSTFSTSAFWHNFTEISIFVRDGIFNTLFVATKLSGGLGEVISEDFAHDLLSFFMFFPCNLDSRVELLVISLVGLFNCTSGRFVLAGEIFFFSGVGLHPVGSASRLCDAFFHSWFILFSHSSEEPGVEAFSGSGLVLWLGAILIGWGNGINPKLFKFHEWGESLGEVDVFLNFHLRVGINNLGIKLFFIYNTKFMLNFRPVFHNGTGFIELGFVESDIGDNVLGLCKVSERHE